MPLSGISLMDKYTGEISTRFAMIFSVDAHGWAVYGGQFAYLSSIEGAAFGLEQ